MELRIVDVPQHGKPRVRIIKEHYASFRGLNNRSKAKTLITLFLLEREHWISGLIAKDLARASGVSYDYLVARLSKWRKWGYLKRRAVDVGKGRPQFKYSLAKRGEHFILDIIPRAKLQEYREEVNRYRAEQGLYPL